MRVPKPYLLVLAAIAIAAVVLLVAQWNASQAVLSQAEAVLRKDPGPEKCQKVRPSALAKKYLENLHGIEIGASTQNSFDLKRSINVDFSDEQGGLWQHKSCEPVVVNIVANGDALPFKDGTLDYVVSAHVIEHFFDPVKALREWHRVVRKGGYVFIIAPHRDRMFDKEREVTGVDELIERSRGKLTMAHYWRALDPKAPSPHRLVRDRKLPLEDGWDRYKEDDHHHWSVWRTADFLALVQRLGFTVVESHDVDDKYGNGFTVVIRK